MDEQAEIVQIAYAHIGDKFRLGANGPTKFDCSGFVWSRSRPPAWRTGSAASRCAPSSSRRYFRERGLLFNDPSQARVGDLAFYGNPAKHSAIVTRIDNKGRPRITSALTIGVRETKYNTLDVKFDSFAHVGLGLDVAATDSDSRHRRHPDSTPRTAPTDAATPTPAPQRVARRLTH